MKNKDIAKGVDIARNIMPINPLIKRDYITLKKISSKPNTLYEISLTKKGIKKQKELKNFIKYSLSQYLKDVKEFEKTLKQYNLT